MTAREVLGGALVQTALALGFVAFPEIPEERDSAEAQITTTVARLTRAVEAVLGLHQPVAIYELDDEGCVDDSKHVRDICGVCSDSSVTESLDDGNYDLAGEWGEVGWPCPTVAAIEDALNPKEGQ